MITHTNNVEVLDWIRNLVCARSFYRPGKNFSASVCVKRMNALAMRICILTM